MGLLTRWGMRNLTLACPQCKNPAAPSVFKRARYQPGERQIACERCGHASFVTLWRFAGIGYKAAWNHPVHEESDSRPGNPGPPDRARAAW